MVLKKVVKIRWWVEGIHRKCYFLADGILLVSLKMVHQPLMVFEWHFSKRWFISDGVLLVLLRMVKKKLNGAFYFSTQKKKMVNRKFDCGFYFWNLQKKKKEKSFTSEAQTTFLRQKSFSATFSKVSSTMNPKLTKKLLFLFCNSKKLTKASLFFERKKWTHLKNFYLFFVTMFQRIIQWPYIWRKAWEKKQVTHFSFLSLE